MPVIVAHQEDCAIVVNGPTRARQVMPGSYVDEPTVCTCGGVMVHVDLHRPGDQWAYNMTVRQVSDGPKP